MRLSLVFSVSSLALMADAFVPAFLPNLQRTQQHGIGSFDTSLPMSSDFGSDFQSAMPSKPELTLQERLEQSATEFIAMFTGRLEDGVPEPPEVEALREARDSNAKPAVIAARVYELMIEQGMLYDENPETGSLSPTDFDIKSSLDDPVVKQEFAFLYKYGMNLVTNGMIDVETVKSIVKDRLIARTGLSPEEFDEWLGY
uniref:Uncharacterized protein n=1 Tax=Trieres chinensis TaxID=1514140 RepID=A0A7S2EDZ8_TRICV|mmetsp:Transcript_18667/g.37848  ORF Transcript_18667/g.37848 Transcript_18667/m.37848 type:complete len:200 (+) Transcript_18667:110-709(+)|eukprot:CAMPEP_0183294666 /NCGR_PEP_ID=MMETSP0160_2-20130417/2911_1 /TAXON_ID=2839 ORGANISM="Odontella Sinensis, Strain Grunow 1884" /NCGR_SAMPLE_ID=MMETSP0160_2 /ASSEMBLY_ACC=CAM_ASM_000250 /LENGTH=199 /DNA_ID=CAMNT_0025456021 /DNA_START=87 /DNA_END=686 /DNA_ORIENTATION=+